MAKLNWLVLLIFHSKENRKTFERNFLQSLVHFTLTNPGWRMPTEAKQFVHSIKRHAMHDIDRTRIGANTAMEQSLFSVGSMGGEVSFVFLDISTENKKLISSNR